MRNRIPGLAYDTPGGYRGLDCYAQKDLQLDKGAMSATGVLATSAKDRIGDVIEVAGISLANHQVNPIVLWDHGWRSNIPIGKTEDPSGAYTVRIDGEKLIATTFFSQSNLEGLQVYALIDEGIIRAKSIGFRSLKAESILENDRFTGLHILECELLEDTWCAVPCNQEAVTAMLSKNLVCGKSLAPAIRRSLLPYAAPPKAWSPGATMPTPAPVAPVIDSKTVAVANAIQAAAPTVNQVRAAKADAPTATPTDDKPVEPHGAAFHRALHKAYSGIKDLCDQHGAALEPDSAAKAFADAHGLSAEENMGAIQDSFGENYPDLDPIEGAKDDGAGGEDSVDEEVKDDDTETDNEEKDGDAEEETKADDDLTDEEKALLEREIARLERECAHEERLLARAS